MRHSLSPWLCLFFLFSMTAPLRAQTVETATAATLPWSGWWWPAQSGSLVLGYRDEPGALVKLDALNGQHASQWEQSMLYHFDPSGPIWWGHCHAWAAASLLEPEPLHDVVQGGQTFHVGDLKGLLTEAHFSDHATFFGQRYYGNPGDDFQDMYPLLVWSVLRTYIRDNQIGIIFDLDPGVAVSNHPCYCYRVITWPQDGDNVKGQITIWVASYDVPPDYVGTSTETHDYFFTFQVKDGEPVPGSDHWIGPSVADHPDFAWYPSERGQENPELDYNLVTQLNQKAH